jgi:hypothetical protein
MKAKSEKDLLLVFFAFVLLLFFVGRVFGVWLVTVPYHMVYLHHTVNAYHGFYRAAVHIAVTMLGTNTLIFI